MRCIGLLAAFAVILGGCIAFAQIGKQILHPEADEKDISAWASAAEAQLGRWGVKVEKPKDASAAGDTQSGAINVFLALLCRQNGWGELDRGTVDGEYLSRLPESAEKLARNPKEADVREVMIGLLKHLGGEVKEDDREPKAIIADIADRMDYRQWYTSKARKASFTGRNPSLPKEQRRFIYRFCPSYYGEDGGLCKTLYQKIMTSQWGIKGLCEEDLRQRPWFVAGCFFEFLSQAQYTEVAASQASTSQPTSERGKSSGSPALELLQAYLPQRSELSRTSLRGDNLELPIKKAIDTLAGKHGIETQGEDSNTVLSKLIKHLKDRARDALRIDKDLPESTRWYLERLACPGPTPTSKPVEKGTGE